MPQLQTVVLSDRASTPVDHTFVPAGIDQNGVGKVIETLGVPVGNNTLTISMRKTNGRFRGRLHLSMPVVQTVTDGQGIERPTVVRTASAWVDFVFDETSTTQERNDLVGILESALGTSKVLINDTIVNLEGVY